MSNFPKISIVMPTFNSEKRLEKCLRLIRRTNYPQDKIEIIVADGGSTDCTIEIAKKYKCVVFDNLRKLPEPGKAVGINNSTGDLICFLDDDNFVVDVDFFNKMCKPFKDKNISAAEPWSYVQEKGMTPLERYWAIMGLNDPVMYYMGCYDRLNVLTNHWTSLSILQKDKGGYIEFDLSYNKLPTIGANGFMIRSDLIKKIDYENLLDLDKVAEIVRKGYSKFAKVKVGIVHTFVPNLSGYWKKCLRKANSFYGEVGYSGQDVNELSKRIYKYPNFKKGLLKFVLSTVLVIPNLLESFCIFAKTRDLRVSFYHFPVCWITLIGYGKKTLLKRGR